MKHKTRKQETARIRIMSVKFRNLEMKAVRDHHDATDYLPVLIKELYCIRDVLPPTVSRLV